MPDCSEIQHIAGYDRDTGQWIEEYFYIRPDGQVFVFLRNDPPEGQKSQTPPDQVGLENGFCIVSEAPEAVESVQTTSEPRIEPILDGPRTLDIGAGVWIVGAIALAITGGICMSNSKEKNRQRQYDAYLKQQKPLDLNPSTVIETVEDEDKLILSQLYSQAPLDVALKSIWNVSRDSQDYEKYKEMYLDVRKQYEIQFPAAKFEDTTV